MIKLFIDLHGGLYIVEDYPGVVWTDTADGWMTSAFTAASNPARALKAFGFEYIGSI